MEVKIKRIRSARHLRLRVLPSGQVVVTCHPFTPQAAISAFIAEHQSWIDEKLQVINTNKIALVDTPKTLLFRGKEYVFRLQVKTYKEKVEVATGQIIVTSNSEDHAHVRLLLEKWYRQQAKVYFTHRVPLLCDVADRDIMNVTIRSQRTRWGSCSSRSTISLNWRLIMTPDSVSDYVIYHEIAHLTHMNHSKKFWQLVEVYCPRYKEAEKWLKDHHQLLQF